MWPKVLTFMLGNWKTIVNVTGILYTGIKSIRKIGRLKKRGAHMPDIKESLEIFDAVDALSAALAAAKKDGEVNWLDLPKFVPVIAKARTAADGSEKIKDELKDLDNAEMKQLLERACTSVSGLVAAILKKDEKAS